MNRRLTIAECATLACLLEATAPKPGNVHRGADFADLAFTDFVVAAVGIGRAVESASSVGVGAAAAAAARSMMQLTGRNTSLGTILLCCPLAVVPHGHRSLDGVEAVLKNLASADSEGVYEAIRCSQPGGMGKVEAMDVAGEAPPSLLDAMGHAASYDLVARQYVNGYADIARIAVPELLRCRESGMSLTSAIVHLQLVLLRHFPDSLIQRKCGLEVAEHASLLANVVLDAGPAGSELYHEALADLDFWLRGDGNRRNPGTTADLIAATLFVVLKDELIEPPYR